MRLGGFTALVAAVLALAGAGAASAASPGSLDPAFNGSGMVQLATGTQLFGVAVQPDGRIVAAGQSGGKVFVERFTTSGAANGQYTGPSGSARAVAIEPDGKIVVAGTSGGAMLVERLTAALAPDSGFGSGGAVTVFAGQNGLANGVAVEPDGSVVAAGTTGSYNTSFAVARIGSTGGVQWSTSFQPLGLPYAAAEGVAVQPNGAIVIAGMDQGSPSYAFINGLAVRMTASGSLDSSFASGGVFSYHYPGGGYTSFQAVALQGDGKIVLGGIDVGGPNAIFARLSSNGGLDNTFGSGGVTALPSGFSTHTGDPIGAYGVGIAGGGRIVGAGNYQNTGTVVDATTWAFSPTGSPETAFGSGGVNRNPTGGYEHCALAIAPDGSLVTAGNTVTTPNDMSPCSVDSSEAGFVARYVGYGPPPAPPSGAKPSVTTGTAGPVGQTSATVSGTVNPNGLATSYRFDYGTSTKYGSASATGTLPASNGQTAVSSTLTGLAPGTTYHYRLVAGNADGTADGADETFTTTSTARPSATTGRAKSIGEVSATVLGELAPHGLSTTYHFEYGRTSAYGKSTRAQSVSGTAQAAVQAKLRRLRPGTRYHYRLVATNADGTSYGADRTFRTAPRLRLELSKLSSSYSIPAVERHGLAVRIGCNQRCSIHGSLLVSAATAKALGLGTRRTSIGGGSHTLRHRGSATVVLHLTTAAEHALAGHKSLSLTLRIRGAPFGGPSVTISKTIAFTG